MCDDTYGARPSRISHAELLLELRHVLEPADNSAHALLIAAERDPTDPMPLYRLADLSRYNGLISLWDAIVDHALKLTHDSQEQIYHRAKIKLLREDWSGWRDYEARYFCPSFRFFREPYPRSVRWTWRMWDGVEDLHRRTLLVVAEQGFGDTIQMLRFVPELACRAGKLVLAVPSGLVSFVQYNYSQYASVTFMALDRRAPIDRFVWMMSLPGYSDRLPSFAPLQAPKSRSRSGIVRRPLKIGLCWAGSPTYSKDTERSIPLSAFDPLLARNDIEWYSLQLAPGGRCVQSDVRLRLPDTLFRTFRDTADFIVNLDAVVSVDTAVCHLAGSLGVPTFLLLNAKAVWRWGLREETPWYPTMVLIRQVTQGDWVYVLNALSQKLDARSGLSLLGGAK